MANYVDGFLIPVPKKKVKDYQKLAKACGKVMMLHSPIPFDGKRMIWGGFKPVVRF